MTATLRGLVGAVAAEPSVAEAVRRARLTGTAQATEALDVTAPSSLYPLIAAALADDSLGGRPLLVVTATAREAEDLVTALESLLPEHAVAEFPAWETLPHERLSPSSDTVGRRLAVLRRLAHPSSEDPAAGPVRVLVAPVRAVLQPVVKGLGDLEPVAVRPRNQRAHLNWAQPTPQIHYPASAAARADRHHIILLRHGRGRSPLPLLRRVLLVC